MSGGSALEFTRTSMGKETVFVPCTSRLQASEYLADEAIKPLRANIKHHRRADDPQVLALLAD